MTRATRPPSSSADYGGWDRVREPFPLGGRGVGSKLSGLDAVEWRLRSAYFCHPPSIFGRAASAAALPPPLFLPLPPLAWLSPAAPPPHSTLFPPPAPLGSHDSIMNRRKRRKGGGGLVRPPRPFPRLSVCFGGGNSTTMREAGRAAVRPHCFLASSGRGFSGKCLLLRPRCFFSGRADRCIRHVKWLAGMQCSALPEYYWTTPCPCRGVGIGGKKERFCFGDKWWVEKRRKNVERKASRIANVVPLAVSRGAKYGSSMPSVCTRGPCRWRGDLSR